MNDRLHEIMAKCVILHNKLIDEKKINNLEEVEEELNTYEDDVKEHYLKLLMQYYFQKNNLEGLKELLLQGYKFDLRFEDITQAFLHITKENSVIEFYEEQVVLLKDSITEEELLEIKNYYENNNNLQEVLEFPLSLLKRNRYVCSFAYKHRVNFGNFFINEDLLESIKKDLPYLLK